MQHSCSIYYWYICFLIWLVILPPTQLYMFVERILKVQAELRECWMVPKARKQKNGEWNHWNCDWFNYIIYNIYNICNVTKMHAEMRWYLPKDSRNACLTNVGTTFQAMDLFHHFIQEIVLDSLPTFFIFQLYIHTYNFYDHLNIYSKCSPLETTPSHNYINDDVENLAIKSHIFLDACM